LVLVGLAKAVPYYLAIMAIHLVSTHWFPLLAVVVAAATI
jgi:hypothetical protein